MKRWKVFHEIIILCRSFYKHFLYINNLLANIMAQVILVGHSCGGASISYALECFPKKITKAVFVSATMVPDGQRPFDMFAEEVSASYSFVTSYKHQSSAGPHLKWNNCVMPQQYLNYVHDCIISILQHTCSLIQAIQLLAWTDMFILTWSNEWFPIQLEKPQSTVCFSSLLGVCFRPN